MYFVCAKRSLDHEYSLLPESAHMCIVLLLPTTFSPCLQESGNQYSLLPESAHKLVGVDGLLRLDALQHVVQCD